MLTHMAPHSFNNFDYFTFKPQTFWFPMVLQRTAFQIIIFATILNKLHRWQSDKKLVRQQSLLQQTFLTQTVILQYIDRYNG